MKTQASIDLFDETEQKAFEKRRTFTSKLLDILAFSVVSGIRLVPRASTQLLERELERSESAAIKELESIFLDMEKALQTQLTDSLHLEDGG